MVLRTCLPRNTAIFVVSMISSRIFRLSTLNLAPEGKKIKQILLIDNPILFGFEAALHEVGDGGLDGLVLEEDLVDGLGNRHFDVVPLGEGDDGFAGGDALDDGGGRALRLLGGLAFTDSLAEGAVPAR